jgi:hypothetical protein
VPHGGSALEVGVVRASAGSGPRAVAECSAQVIAIWEFIWTEQVAAPPERSDAAHQAPTPRPYSAAAGSAGAAVVVVERARSAIRADLPLRPRR